MFRSELVLAYWMNETPIAAAEYIILDKEKL